MKRTCVFFPVTLWMSDRGETRRVQHNEALARDVLLENKRDRNDGAVILDFFSQQQNPDYSQCCGIQSGGFSENAHMVDHGLLCASICFSCCPVFTTLCCFPF